MLSRWVFVDVEIKLQQAEKKPIKDGAPGRIRTVDLVLRRHTLYPSELRAQSGINSSWVDCITFRWWVAMEWRAITVKAKIENGKLRLGWELVLAAAGTACGAPTICERPSCVGNVALVV